ncbi:MAG TPA: TonB-dependent receptor [Marinagarivorans sp.]
MLRLKAQASIVCLLLANLAAAEDNYLETIVVTAQRTPTALQDMTQAVTVVDSESLSRINADHMHQLFQQVSGTWVSRGSGQEHLTAIRSPVFTGAGACGAFQMSQDGIPLRAAGFCNANQLFDSHYEAAAAVEVQRGPNSALRGSNALFGSIDIRMPKASEPAAAKLSLEASNQAFYRLNVAKPFQGRSGGADWFAAATVTDNTDERDSAGYQQQKMSLKRQTDRANTETQSGFSITNLNQQTAGYINGKDAYKNAELRLQNENPDAYRKSLSLHGYHRMAWQRGDATVSITPYARHADMEFLMHFLPWQPVERNKHSSVGLQADYEKPLSSTLALRAGGDAEVTRGQLSEVQENEAPFGAERFPVGTHYDYSVDALSGAAYAGLEWLPSDGWLLRANLRGDYQRYEYDTNAEAGSACADGVENCRFYRPADRSDTYSTISSALGVRYLITDSQAVFVNAASGFRAPQATELYRLQQEQTFADLDAVELKSIEAGWRGGFARVNYQLALFYMEMKNGIFQDTNRANVSGAQTRHRGLEYEVSTQLLDDLSFQLAGTIAQHKYANSPDMLDSDAAIKGNFIDTAPEKMHSALLSWQVTDKVSGYLEGAFMGDYYLDPENAYRYEGHQVANARIQWAYSSDLAIAASVLNIFDSRYADRADVSFGEERYFPGQSRHASLSLTWSGF